jgi:hypothetical protein
VTTGFPFYVTAAGPAARRSVGQRRPRSSTRLSQRAWRRPEWLPRRLLRISVETQSADRPKLAAVDDRTLLWLEIATFVFVVLVLVLV